MRTTPINLPITLISRYDYWEKKLNSKITAEERKAIAEKQAALAAEASESAANAQPTSESSSVSSQTAVVNPPASSSNKPEPLSDEDHADYNGAFSARPRSLFLIAFTVVVREGLESVVFLAGIGQGNPVALILPGIVGIIVGTIIGLIVYFGAGKFRLDIFLKVSAAFLFVIAAGLAAGAAHEFEEDYYYRNPQYGMEETTVLWDFCDCCSQKTNAFFAIMYALVGWRCKATIATVATYFGYWLVVITGIVIFMWWKKRMAKKGKLAQALGGKPTDGVEALAVTVVDGNGLAEIGQQVEMSEAEKLAGKI